MSVDGQKAKTLRAYCQPPEECQLQFISIIEAFGFEQDRARGSHRVYKHPKVVQEFLVVQPDKNGQAKPYQIKQFLSLVETYDLRLAEADHEETDE